MRYVGQKTGGFDKKYLGSGKYFKRAVKKYGRDGFKQLGYYLAAFDQDELDRLEISEIKNQRLMGHELYNILPGGKFSPYASFARTGLPTITGENVTLKGKPKSPEHAAKLRANLARIRPLSVLAIKGKPMSEENKQKHRVPKHPGFGALISKAKKGVPCSEKHRNSMSESMKARTLAGLYPRDPATGRIVTKEIAESIKANPTKKKFGKLDAEILLNSYCIAEIPLEFSSFIQKSQSKIGGRKGKKFGSMIRKNLKHEFNNWFESLYGHCN